MEGIGVAANIIAVVDLSAKVATLCLQYSKEVASARADIQRLQHQVKHLGNTMQAAKALIERTEPDLLPTSTTLNDSIDKCLADLTKLAKKLEPNTKDRVMRHVGFRALKWPFSSQEVDQTLSNLERHEQTIMLGLQIDQTSIMVDIRKGVEQLALRATENATRALKPRRLLPFPPDPDFIHRPAIKEKSQLAIEFAHQVHIDHPDTSIFWVHRHTRETFEESYRALAELRALPRRQEPEIDILALVRDWPQRDDTSPWFIILDNADDVSMFFPSKEEDTTSQRPLASCLPKSPIGRILVTSRSRGAAEKLAGGSRIIQQITVIRENEALELFHMRIKSTTDESAAIKLVHALDYIPLAVNQAVAYINRRSPRVTAASYLQEFRTSEKRKDSLLRSNKGDLGRHDQVSNSIVVTWQVTFEQIRRESPRTANLLSLISQFHAQNIPEKMLYGYEEEDASTIKTETDTVNTESEGSEDSCEEESIDEESIEEERSDEESSEDMVRQDLEDDMNVLRGYYLVNLLAEEGLCEMHPLVQFCTRSWISGIGNAARWRGLFIKLAAESFPFGSFENRKMSQRLLPHMEPIMSGKNRAGSVADQVEILTRLGSHLQMTGDYSRAERLTAEAVQVGMDHFGPEHPYTLRSSSELSMTYLWLGRTDEAGKLQEKVWETATKTLGNDHPLTLLMGSGLATIYLYQCRSIEAEELLTDHMEGLKARFGASHPRTLAALADLAIAYTKQGRLEKSEELFVEVFETQKASLGPGHPQTLKTLSNLAWHQLGQGRLEEAEKLAVEALRMRTETFGDNHPITIRSGSLVASIFFRQGRLEEAEKLWAGVLESSRVQLGTDHPTTLKRQQTLATTMHAQGRTQEAIALMQSCVHLRQQRQGHGHPHTRECTAVLEKWQHQVSGRENTVKNEADIRGSA